jgi:sugar phosphate isomerase/epimerase
MSVLPSPNLAAEGTASRPAFVLALQLWTVRELVEADMPLTLQRVATLGYRAVELAGVGSAGPAVVRGWLGDAGLEVVSVHVSCEELLRDPDRVAEDVAGVGGATAVIPAYPSRMLETADGVRRLADRLDTAARRLGRHSLRLALHNEQDQLASLDGTTPWELLVAGTDPALVDLQLDVVCAVAAGRDPLELLEAGARRITSLHVCDWLAGRYAPVGRGGLDWTALLRAIRATACRSLIVEHEGADDPLLAARDSLRALQALLGAGG